MSDPPPDLAWLAGELISIRRQLLPQGESPALYLALDQGGSASRALLFDAVGREVAAAHVPIGTSHEGTDRVEHDPEELVRSVAVAAQDVCDAEPAQARPIAAAGLATQRSTIVCWERGTGRAVSPAISWQDRRNAAWLEQTLRSRAAWVRGLTGLVLSPHYGASKLRWCLDHLPDVQAAARAGALAAGPLSSYLAFRLLEEQPVVVDPGNASRTSLFDPDTLDWSPELLDAFGIPGEILPRCVGTQHDFGTLKVGGRSIPMRACTGDQSAAAFAFGRPVETAGLVNVGTGAFVQRATDARTALPRGLLRSVLSSRRDKGGDLAAAYSHEGTVNGAGSAIDWLRGRVALDVDRALQNLSPDRPAGEPPLFVNGVGGLGAPYWQHDFPIEFVGDGNELMQLTAVIESIAFLLAVNLEAMQQAAPLLRISISGGLSNCDYLCRSLAELSGLVVERYALREATARGVAFLAAGEPDDWQVLPVDRVFTPGGNDPLRARFARWRGEMERRGAVVH
jgi:glycerol kinase